MKTVTECKLHKREPNEPIISEVARHIYRTNDFNQFVLNGRNREVKEYRIRAFRNRLLKTGQTVFLRTIEVVRLSDGKLLITDGHLRFMVAKMLYDEGYDVYIEYQVKDTKEFEEQGLTVDEYLKELNDNQQKWPLRDRVKFYVDDGKYPERKKAYESLLEFEGDVCDYFGRDEQLRVATAIITEGTCGVADLTNGRLQTHTMLSRAQANFRLRQLKDILDAFGFQPKNQKVEFIMQGFYEFLADDDCRIEYEYIGYRAFLKKLSEITPEETDSCKRGDWAKVFRKAVGL